MGAHVRWDVVGGRAGRCPHTLPSHAVLTRGLLAWAEIENAWRMSARLDGGAPFPDYGMVS